MLHFLQRTLNEGKKPSWKALTCAIKALGERGEWDRAREVVRKAKRSIDASRQQGQRYGQREFWRLAVDMGLLDERSVPTVGNEHVSRAKR